MMQIQRCFARLVGVIALGFMSVPLGTAQNLLDVQITRPGDTAVTEKILLALDKSTIVDLGAPAADIVITNPAIADAAVQTAERMIFRGIAVGQTNAFVFDREGNQLLNLEITVAPDLTGLNEMITRHVPSARVTAEAVGANIALRGFADSIGDVDRIGQLAGAFLDRDDILNFVGVDAVEQVMLQVRIVELSRSVAKQLGVDLSGSTVIDDNLLLSAATANGFPLAGNLASAGFDDGTTTALGTLSALETIGILRTLAEPNITTISGETANFLAGGEFPVPTGETDDGTATIEFQPFGIALGFTPVVLNKQRISLKVSTEVSELSTEGAITSGAVTVPSLTVRRAETTVELPSGKSMMIAGLLQASTKQDLSALPGIRKLPILGALFQGRDFSNDESELVIMVTPLLVDPARTDELTSPADGFRSANDAEAILFGKINKVYGKNRGGSPPGEYNAPIGWIEE